MKHFLVVGALVVGLGGLTACGTQTQPVCQDDDLQVSQEFSARGGSPSGSSRSTGVRSSGGAKSGSYSKPYKFTKKSKTTGGVVIVGDDYHADECDDD